MRLLRNLIDIKIHIEKFLAEKPESLRKDGIYFALITNVIDMLQVATFSHIFYIVIDLTLLILSEEHSFWDKRFRTSGNEKFATNITITYTIQKIRKASEIKATILSTD